MSIDTPYPQFKSLDLNRFLCDLIWLRNLLLDQRNEWRDQAIAYRMPLVDGFYLTQEQWDYINETIAILGEEIDRIDNRHELTL